MALTQTPSRETTRDPQWRGSSPRKGRGTSKLRFAARPGRVQVAVRRPESLGPTRQRSSASGFSSVSRAALSSQAPYRTITNPHRAEAHLATSSGTHSVTATRQNAAEVEGKPASLPEITWVYGPTTIGSRNHRGETSFYSQPRATSGCLEWLL